MPHGARQGGTRGVEESGMEEAGGARSGGTSSGALPGVEPDVVVVPARRHERSLAAHARLQLEAEHVAVEPNGTVEVGDLEMNVTYLRALINRVGHARRIVRRTDQPSKIVGSRGSAAGSKRRSNSSAS